jgi:hypothetical protein
MHTKRGNKTTAPLEVSVVIILIAFMLLGYIILLPEESRNELLDLEPTDLDSNSDGGIGGNTLLSEAPGAVTSLKSATKTRELEPMRLYSVSEQATQTLAASLTVSRGLFQNNKKTLTFDSEHLEDLEDLSLLFFISESKGDMTIELNEQIVFEGRLTSSQLPLDLPIKDLNEEDNTLTLSVDSPGINVFSPNYYIMQDIKLIEDYRVADTVSTRTFSVDKPGDVVTASLSYFITCNTDDQGILTISLNNREVFADRVFCEYLTQRELALNDDYLQKTNTLRFEISEGDYNIEEVEIEVKTKSEDFPTFNFDVSTELYDLVESGEKEVIMKLSFSDETSEKAAEVLVQEFSFAFDTENNDYQKDISSMLDNGANSITIKPETSFEIDNIKVFSQ